MDMNLNAKSIDRVLISFNWFGLVSGILMMLLPFLGPWWIGTVGRGAMEIKLSPFDLSISLLYLPIHSSMIEFFLLAAKITFVVSGVFMLLSSVFPMRWWSRRLFMFGVMKPFWSVVGLVALLIVSGMIFNFALPSVLPSLIGGEQENVKVNIDVPYVCGSTVSTVEVENMATVTAPVLFSLTGIFWLAVATAVLCIIARFYRRRLVPS
jgi:hypothetical protein